MPKRMPRKNTATSKAQSKDTWGGAREGAGRKKSSPFVSHVKRPRVQGRQYPVLITLRLRSGFESLREPTIFEVFHKASLRARRFGLRIIEYRIYDKSISLLCEFKNSQQLEKSFKSLNTALAIILKKTFEKHHKSPHRGPVFLGRYMLEEINDARRLRRVVQELLLEDADAGLPQPIFGLHSSAIIFEKWRALLKDFPPSATHFLRQSGQSEAHAQAHVDDLKIAREITASPQFWFTKNALRSLS